jgi:heavy metal sensor kinase
LLAQVLSTQKLGIRGDELSPELLKKLDAAKREGQDIGTIEKSLKIVPQVARSGEVFVPFALADEQAGGGGANAHYLFYATPILVKDAIAGILVLGRPREDEIQSQSLLLTLLLAAPATLLITAIGGYWLATRTLRPVRAITRAAREISETELGRRLNLASTDELGELAATFDSMLGRLESAFQRQRQFTADASHELRTPLTIVSLEANHALSGARTQEEYQRALEVIQAENECMARLVNEMLVLARADSGQALIRQEEIDLSDLTLEIAERLDPLARSSGVALQIGELPELQISGDRQYLGQMVTNLVENAIKYAGEGCKWVRVDTGSTQDSARPSAWLRVADNGTGIAPEHLPHLFDRFYRVDEARSRDGTTPGEGRPSGSGLGLSIVQWVAQAHGGEVLVESQLGAGSTFEVRLPLAGPC